MPFTLIQGTFHVVGSSPDGDTVKFQAADTGNWSKLTGPPAKRNAREQVSLRFEAIDALETHFEGRHQPLDLALSAQQAMLSSIGIRNLRWNEPRTLVVAAEEGSPGYILSRAVEGNRRVVAFVFAGEPRDENGALIADGSEVMVTAEHLKMSVNYRLAEAGLVYPTYYQGLFADLHKPFTEAVQAARENKRGVWERDQTRSGVRISGITTIMDDEVMLPKLFRRMSHYLTGGGSITGFRAFLTADPDPLLVVSDGRFTNLDTLIEQDGEVVRMTEDPENLVFIPRVAG